MATQAIEIKINADVVKTLGELKKLQKEVNKSFQTIGKASVSVDKSFKDVNKTISETNKNLKETSATTAVINDTAVRLGRSLLGLFLKLGKAFLKNDNFLLDLSITFNNLAQTVKREIIPNMILLKDLFTAIATGDVLKTIITLKRLDSQASKSFSNITESAQDLNRVIEGESLDNMERFKSAAVKAGVGLAAVSTELVQASIVTGDFDKLVKKLPAVMSRVGDGFRRTAAFTKDLAKVTTRSLKTVIAFDKGLFGFVSSLATAGTGLVFIGQNLKQLDNEFARVAGTISVFAGLVLGGLSVVLAKAITSIGEFAFAAGTKLAEAFVNASDKFIELEKKAFVFSRTLLGFNRAFGESIGTTERWEEQIEKVSKQTGFLEKNLRSSVTEIVATTAQMGFNEQQMRKLLDIAVDYSSFLGTDVIQTTIEFISALNGSAQSVQKYGVKLGAAQLQNKLYAKGLDKNFQSLSESEKLQIRWNSLLSQYKPIAGTAADVTTTLAGQNKLLENNITKINEKIGEGAAIIENYAALQLLANAAISTLSDGVFKAFGIIGALGARVLQVGGLFIKWSFTVFTLIKAYKLLNVILGSDAAFKLFAANIPFLNNSINGLVASLGVANVRLNSVKATLITTATLFKVQSKQIVASILGINAANLTLASGLKATAVLIKGRFIASLKLLKRVFFAALGNPVVLAIVGTIAAFKGLFEAFKFINAQTGVFNDLYSVLVELLTATSPILQPVIDLFTRFGKIVSGIAEKAFGLFIDKIAQITQFTTRLLASNPFNIFNKKQLDKIKSAGFRVADLRDRLERVDFAFTKLNKNAARNLASLDFNFKKTLDPKKLEEREEFLKSFAQTFEEMLDTVEGRIAQAAQSPIAGLFGKLKVSPVFQKQIEALDEAFKKGLITQKEYQVSLDKLVEAQENFNINTVIGGVGGLAKQILGGKQGAKELVTSLGKTAANAIIPGLGEALGPLLDAFAQGPEEVRKMVNEFAQALPDVVENIILSIPAFIEAIADNIDIIVERLIEKLPDIVDALVRAMPRVSVALATALAIDVPRAISSQAPKMGTTIALELAKSLPSAIVESFKEAFGKIGNLFKLLFRFDGGGKGPVERFLGFDFPFIAFARGGKVPGSAPFSGDNLKNDLVPALLSPGEMVIPRSAMSNGLGGVLGFLQEMGFQQFGLGGLVKKVLGGLGGVFRGVLDPFDVTFGVGKGGIFKKASQALSDIYGGTPLKFLDELKGIPEGVFGLFTKITSAIGIPIDELIGLGLPKDLIAALNSLINLGANINIVDLAEDILRDPVNFVGNVTKSILPRFQDNFRRLLSVPFADGGMVPAGFPNDSFPARLSSGEFVVNNSLTPKLESFLDGNQGASEVSDRLETNNILLAQILDLLGAPQQLSTSIEMNENELARAILEINRNNQRLA